MLKIACIGQQCSGKTTLAKFFMKEYLHNYHIKQADPIYAAVRALGYKKHRAFMQEFGDLAKKHFGKKIFTEVFSKKVRETELNIINHHAFDAIDENRALIINDDVRFDWELENVKTLGFITISIKCSAEVRKQRAKKQGYEFLEKHNSEIEIQDLIPQADHIIENGEMHIDELQLTALKILNKINSDI